MLESHRPLYDLMFGDVPMIAWPADTSRAKGEPWDRFVEARAAWSAGDRDRACELWAMIAGTDGLESRHIAQAWHCLRGAGITPEPEVAGRVLGVILEVPVGPGLDVLAAYADRTAWYLNHAGPATHWGRPDDRLDGEIAALLAAGASVVAKTGPWHKDRFGPAVEVDRLNVITPGGLHFGQAPGGVLMRDPLAAPVFGAGMKLMQGLMALRPSTAG